MVMHAPARVLCIERKDARAEVLAEMVGRMDGVEWAGRAQEAAGVADLAGDARADIVLLDLDLNGANPFAAVELLRHRHPTSRTIVFSRQVHGDIVERAFAAGAWGFISKREGAAAIAAAIPRVMQDEYVMGPEVEAALMRRN